MPTAPKDLLSGLATLADHERHAQQTLDEKTWAYLFGAAADELTHGRNIEAWRELELLPRALRPSSRNQTHGGTMSRCRMPSAGRCSCRH